VFSIVLELVPEEAAEQITEAVSVPTIGIGAGRYCDGQVLVFHDMLQYAGPNTKKMVKAYANLHQHIARGIADYVREVKSGTFPGEDNVFHADEAVPADARTYS